MTAPREIELKLALADGAASQVPGAAPLAGVRGRRQRFVAAYVDTPGGELSKHGLGLRLRRAGSRWRVTLKAAGATAAGLSDRPEWEFPAAGPVIDLSRFAGTPLAEIPEAASLHERLAPVLVTEFDRTAWLVEPAAGIRLEVALDVGRIRAGGRESRIEEVEIELLEGPPAALFDLAETLAATVAMRPEPASKLARGLELAHSPRLAPVRAGRVDLSPAGSDARAAARLAIAACLDHAQANEAGVLASRDIEFVHQLRVALRRLRSALRLFAGALSPGETEPFVKDVAWAAASLGACRDWDVFVTATLPPLLAAYGEAKESAALLRRARQRQGEARRAARETVASARYGLAMIRLARWLHEAPGTPPPEAPSLKALASQRLRKGAKRLAEGHAAFATLDAPARHALRIRVKRQRYAVEFFSGLFRGKEVARHARRLAEAQEAFGLANDSVTALAQVNELAPSPALAQFARGWFAAREADGTAFSARALRRAVRRPRFWRRKPADPAPAEPAAA